MTPDMSNARFTVIAIALLVSNFAIIFLWARECYCETCPENRPKRFAIFVRDAKQVCRNCAKIHDRRMRRLRSKRPLPWRRAL